MSGLNTISSRLNKYYLIIRIIKRKANGTEIYREKGYCVGIYKKNYMTFRNLLFIEIRKSL